MKRQLAIIVMVVMVLTIMSALASCEPEHIHALTKFEKTEATCTLAGNEEYYQCSECGEMFSDALAQNPITKPVMQDMLAHADADKNHKCDDCGSVIGSHEIVAGNHACGYCGIALSICADENLDHACDVCKATIGTHEAAKGKHTCNYCGDTVTECSDNDDHLCDVCGATLSTCADADTDHACDLCGAEMGVHESAVGGHSCDYCGAPVTECVDDDWNHECDICAYPVGEHVEGDGHWCTYCWDVVSECYDNDRDHYCDICWEKMGIHKPAKEGHFCEYCGYRYTPCVPYEDDGDCTTAIHCTVCEVVLTEAKAHDWNWTINADTHSATCKNDGCVHVVNETAHYSYKEGSCECGLTCENQCEICDGCLDDSCILCKTKCEFRDMSKVINFVPNAVLAAPEGPDGQANGYADIKESLVTEQIVLPDGNKALLVKAPNGASANSGASFLNNDAATIHVYGKNGYNCGLPLIDGKFTTVRMHFTNTGDSEVTFKFSNIDYYYDYGAATITLAPGETKIALIKTSHGNSVGLNSQIIFTKAASAGASVAMWGEFVANENLTSVSVATPANKLQFAIGDTFNAEGLVLKANGTNYSRVYISGNYVTNYDGHTFTAADVGTKTVVVEFAGKLTYYVIEVADHIHNIKYVEATAPVACEKDGFDAYYYCTVDGCGLYFNDAEGSKVVAAPQPISCHTAGSETNVLPGQAIPCANCGAAAGVRSMENWVLFNLPVTYCQPSCNYCNPNTNIKNPKVEAIDYNGIPATKFTIGEGTKGATSNSAFHLNMSSNESGRQTVIPHVLNGSGYTRTVMLYYVNLSDVQVVMNLQNDRGGSHGAVKATVPANGTTVVTLNTASSQNGSNWYNYYVDFNANKDVQFVVYGYMYLNPGETDTPSIASSANKLTYNVGETFTSEGLTLNAKISGVTKTVYATTGFTTNYDGYTFTQDDIGTKTVTVTLAGKTVSYQITVKDANNKCDEGIHEYVFANNDSLFVEMNGSDAMYKKVCSYCGAVTAEAYAAPKISFVPHNKGLDGGHTIEYVTLEDGRIAAKLTFTSDVAAGYKTVVEASGSISDTNVFFPVSGNGRRVYFEMTSSADINLTWQPEFYGDRDGFTFDLKAGVTSSGSRIIKYDTNPSYTSSECPYQEIVANSAIKAGTVVYLTGYFYAPGAVVTATVNTPANKVVYNVGDTFDSTGLSLKPSSPEALFGNVVIYNVTTNFDGYTFTEADAGKFFEVTATFGGVEATYYIKVQG